MRLLAIPTSVAALAGVLACVAPASAATVISHDPRGDATARYDLTKSTFTNTSSRLSFKVHVRDLRGGRTQIFGMNLGAAGALDWSIDLQSVRRSNGHVHTVVFQDMVDGGQKVLCRPKVKWRLAKNVIAGSFARSCVPEPGNLQYQTFLGAGNGTAGDPADWTKFYKVPQD